MGAWSTLYFVVYEGIMRAIIQTFVLGFGVLV